ncbi:hypothetical protein Pla175_08710 [Pirellulimonas nuda]|uniref:DUF2231 domain-containing protein n=1 Tax=Pirellulimonas nuda TaxID=2528009 RepID=A0A518D7R9_9BACT|nr:DUF2231 domain-containing protein [Pirellulimonas nuda]QDU87509.1 hypothetical protein Pla175_08710 [Pirellulimonas nuda]
MQILPPPLPSWDGIHPLVVHFPIALLMVAPLFVLLGILFPRRGFSIGALVLMVLGTASAWVATSSGEAAYSVMDQTMSMDDWELYEEADFAAQAHGEQTELARNIFTGLTVLYAIVLATGSLSSGWRGRVIPQLAVLLVWAPSLGYLANAAHSGGELVHRFGVKALLPEEEPVEADSEADDAADDSEAEEAEQPAESPAEPPESPPESPAAESVEESGSEGAETPAEAAAEPAPAS